MSRFLALVALLGVFFQLCVALDDKTVTCGSVVKLIHKESSNHLHSHSISWGSGSNQQSVTATSSQNDQGSMWLVKEATTAKEPCEVGTPIKCGTTLRLEHIQTGKNLHSHLFRAPLTGNQEVSGFGDGGNGDTGDNWSLQCDPGSGEHWQRGASVSLMHMDTGKYLYTTEQARFTTQNCGHQCPIMGQTEVSASPRKDAKTKWITGQGVYFPPKNLSPHNSEDDDEL